MMVAEQPRPQVAWCKLCRKSAGNSIRQREDRERGRMHRGNAKLDGPRVCKFALSRRGCDSTDCAFVHP